MEASFQDPALEDVNCRPSPGFPDGRRNMFYQFFDNLRHFKQTGQMLLTKDNVWLMSDILKEIHPDSLLLVSQTHALCFGFNIRLNCFRMGKMLTYIPLTIRALKAGKGLRVDSYITRYSQDDNTMGIPLAVISVSSFTDMPLSTVKVQADEMTITAQVRTR